MDEVKEKEENVEGYYEKIKKYNLLKELYKLFGEKVFTTSDKNGYNYITMTKDQIQTYWSDKVNCLGLDGDIKYDTYYLLEGLEKAIDDWDENPSVGYLFMKLGR